MLRTVLGGKIHRATVTQADLHYVGSVTIDRDLVRAAGMVEGEKVQIVDITNGARIETYVIEGPAGGGGICINGAAAHLIEPGDLVILMSFVIVDEVELASHEPKIVHVDARNRVVALGSDPAQAVPGSTDQISSRDVV
ncbi:aspartate 1-decarboxylase [Schumannella sp. 10F1B-5-1]|uniref:aspartate 1-decarboxylase n=1 Tax=Schumannella sp. 10F1B-5-1 TaxID=2590780 RepID=UPI001130B431|nr:aspartate 1-decarboxylase [Schumannella sp. 10F1B-5-1]TPW76975.1 aspartate 1-decarboxylase [Schumannella sp. 10F1B-5-1]